MQQNLEERIIMLSNILYLNLNSKGALTLQPQRFKNASGLTQRFTGDMFLLLRKGMNHI